MRQSTPSPVDFRLRKCTRVTFGAHGISSDAGVLLLRQLDDALGLTRRHARALGDWRQGSSPLPLQDVVRTRVFGIIQGYEDCNDVAVLRHDALFEAACEGARGHGLASQPTLSRFENGYGADEIVRARRELLEHFIARRRGRRLHRLTLDIDFTDDPTHGQQELSFFHGHYGGFCYMQMLVFTEDGDLLRVQLLPVKWDLRGAAVGVLDEIFLRLRQEWPELEIKVRADNGFACPEFYELCEKRRVNYLVNAGTHGVFQERVAYLFPKAEERFAASDGTQTAMLYTSFWHRAQTWDRARRIVAKAQRTPLGPDCRFLVTNLAGPAEAIYEDYAGRGQAENWLKDFKRVLKGDRLSCHSFVANALRLLLYALAYQLAHELRRLAPGELPNAQLDTLRLRVLRAAAVVQQTARKLWVRLNAASPWRDDWAALARRVLLAG